VGQFELFSFLSMVAYAKTGLSCVRESGRGTGTLIARQVGHAGSHRVGTMAGIPGRRMVSSVPLVEHVDCDKGKLSTSFISSRRSAWFHVEHSYSSGRIVKRLFAESTTCRSVGIVGIVMCHHQLQPAFAVALSTILADEPLQRPTFINPTL
jgi:hypothetical protein